MAWTAELKNKSLDGEAIVYTVTYSDGTRSFDKKYRIAGDNLKETVRTQLDQLEGLDAANAANPTGPVNPPETDRALLTFRNRLGRLKAAQRAIDLGVLAPDNAAYLTLKGQIADALAADQTLIQYV